MENKKNIKWIAKTAMMIALLLILQLATASLGQYVTGSCVNFVLAMSVFVGGPASGIVVALLSPIFAFLLGIGPAFFLISPCISVGNLAFVILLSFTWVKNIKKENGFLRSISAVIGAALLKFVVLSILVVKIVLPMLGLPDQKVAVMSVMFSYPQLVTALIGGIIATIVASRLAKSVLKDYFESQK